MARISEQIIEQIRSTADIVEVVSGYVQLKNGVGIILGSVLFMVKRQHLFPLTLNDKSTNVLAAVLVVV